MNYFSIIVRSNQDFRMAVNTLNDLGYSPNGELYKKNFIDVCRTSQTYISALNAFPNWIEPNQIGSLLLLIDMGLPHHVIKDML